MPTLITTWGASDANAYVEVSYVNTYVDGYILGDTSSWTDATTEAQGRAILRATRDIDNMFPFQGRKRDFQQALEFPRVFAVFDYPFSRANLEIQDQDDVERQAQDRVMKACAEQAFYLLKNAGTDETHLERQSQGIQSYSESIGPLSESVSYFGGGGGNFSKLAPDAYAYMKNYRALPRLVRGSAYDGGYR